MPEPLGLALLIVVLAAYLVPAFLAGRRFRKLDAALRRYAARAGLQFADRASGELLVSTGYAALGSAVLCSHRGRNAALSVGSVMFAYRFQGIAMPCLTVKMAVNNPDDLAFVLNRREQFNLHARQRAWQRAKTGDGEIDRRYEARSRPQLMVQRLFGEAGACQDGLLKIDPDRLELFQNELIFVSADIGGEADSVEQVLGFLDSLADRVETNGG